MNIKRWGNKDKSIKIMRSTLKKNGGEANMLNNNIRNDKLALKALLMKNVKVDNQGRVVLAKDDEWRNEDEWNELYRKLKK